MTPGSLCTVIQISQLRSSLTDHGGHVTSMYDNDNDKYDNTVLFNQLHKHTVNTL